MDEPNHDLTEKKLEVYTTHYGTQYVLPIDLILSQEEMLRLLAEVRQQVRQRVSEEAERVE